jgi:hypothetical protein
MKRDLFKRCAGQIAEECEQRSYEDWLAADFPVVFERTFEGIDVQVEILLLESTPEYVHLMVSVDDGGVWAYAPPSQSTIIRRGPSEKG